jgi:hypothetical protein
MNVLRVLRWEPVGGGLLAGIGVALLVQLALSSAPVAASAEAGPERAAVIAAYHRDHNVSDAAASAAVDHELRTAAGVGRAEAALGGSFAGAWYDPDDGGRLHLAVTDTAGQDVIARAEHAFADNSVDDDVRIERRPISRDRLSAVHDAADKALGNLLKDGQVTTYVDDQTSSLVFEYAADASDRDLAELHAAASDAGVPVSLEAASRNDLRADTDACDGGIFGSFLGCDPNIRGSQWIQSGDNVATCSIGFIAWSPLGSPELVTAGHCLAKTGASWYAWAPSAGQQLVGPRSSWQYGPSDWGIIWDQNSPYWSPDHYIYTDPYPQYSVTGVGSSVAGNSICVGSGVMLGSAGHSVCGTITHNDQTITTVDGVTLTHMREANTCNGYGGASGGPFYLSGLGYGIMSSSWSSCDVFYQALSTALSPSNSHL